MTVFLFIFFLLLIAYGILIEYYRRSWNRIPETGNAPTERVSVSVVTAVRDEEHNIGRLLLSLQLQDYPKDLYEVIVADDHSTDGTREAFDAALVPGLHKTYVQLPENRSSKKMALAAAIARATGTLILTTDADCDMNESWISTMVACHVRTGAKFIAAPVRMQQPSTFLGVFQSLDFMALQGITGASVYKQFHAMCNGANLAYTRAAFDEVNGFEGIDAIPSGDDLLLMYKIFRKYPAGMAYLKNTEAIVTTAAAGSWKSFFQQRIRWASKAVHYEDKRIVYVLLLVYLVNVCFLVLAVASVVHYKWLMFLLLFLLAKIIIEFPFVNAVAIFFGQSSLMVYFPFLQPFHILYTILAGWLGRFGSYTWKSRTIKNN